MGAPRAVQHKPCGVWLLQHSDAGASGRPFWITDLDRCDKQLLCPGCGADLQQLFDAGQLTELGADTAEPPARSVEIDHLNEKLQVLEQLQPVLAPHLTSVLRGISTDLTRLARA